MTMCENAFTFFTRVTNAVTFFTDFERIFHMSVKFAFEMYQENVNFQLQAIPREYDKILHKRIFTS